MDDLVGVSVKISNFKCFKEPQGFEIIKPLNIIIGRNNAGKSAVLDMIFHLVTGAGIDLAQWSNRAQPEYQFSVRIDDSVLAMLPQPSSNIGREDCKNGLLHWTIRDRDGMPKFKNIERTVNRPQVSDNSLKEFAQPIINRYQNPFRKFAYRRLSADRDIRVEADQDTLELGPDGRNATNILQRYLNQEDLDISLVEKTILEDLNLIYGEDGDFRRILSRRKVGSQSNWEIYLDEEKKGLVPMSHTGSGVKTILLVLINLLITPRVANRPLSEFLFAFEELENNLHPAVLRRLYLYLAEKARSDKCRFFITTHSHITIDVFSQDENAQIVHVTHDGESAKVATVDTFLHRRSIFQDLGARASDLLQANSVVWVEGPSDRIYFNRWIEEWTNGELRENVHYTCVFSAGSLLAHYCFEDPDSSACEALIHALRINTHAVVLIDSDRFSESELLKRRASRVVDEVARAGGLAWVTAGREVENYIPADALRGLFGETAVIPQPFDDLFAIMKGPKGGVLDKMELAVKVSPLITRDMMLRHSDLAVRLAEVCEKIREWNGGDPFPRGLLASRGAE